MDTQILPSLQDARYEIKFILEPFHLHELERWLNRRPFIRQAYSARQVNSIYFDTADFRAATDNLKGIANRKKYRLRWYDNPNQTGQITTLEVKVKTGRLGTKHSAPLNKPLENVLSMPPQEIEQEFHRNPAVRSLIPREANLLPILYIGYERSYFEAPSNIRITIDRQLNFRDIFHKHENSNANHADYNKAILEIKFPVAAKDDAAEFMSSLMFYPVRSSKYLLGLSLTGNAIYI